MMRHLAFLQLAYVLLLFPTMSYSKAFIIDPLGRRIELKERPLPPRHNECHLCHPAKKREFISRKTSTKIEHEGKTAVHGLAEVACHNCHDINHSNYLRSSHWVEASFENSSGVCSRCHADRYRDWRSGAHGKRIGFWDGAIVQYQCVDCHNPHSVPFKKMESTAMPKFPKFLIHKDLEDPEKNSNGGKEP
jgi:hypothetical protein